MTTIFLVDLESVSTRYTCEWKTHLPKLLKQQGHDVHVVSGPSDIPQAVTPGAFLNFGGTNIYKAEQVKKLAELFTNNLVPEHSHFIFTDAWHPGILNLKYMSSLLNVPIKIHALWHAGSYDPQDFLGRLIGSAPWVRSAERSFFNAVDYNYFATDFHIKMFRETYVEPIYKFTRTGWPMEYLINTLAAFNKVKKQDVIVFPHRIAPEKQVEIFRDLAKHLPEYTFVVAQDKILTTDEYHTLLASAKIVFSCSLQETLGIGCYEGAIVNAVPLVPDRLSYREMYNSEFKYPSEWTLNWKLYEEHRPQLINHIKTTMSNYDQLTVKVKQQTKELSDKFFTATMLLENLK
jgi:glycosyltransferase involved in cell wall biosynthesis